MMTTRELIDDYREVLDLMENGEIDEQTGKDTLEGIEGEIEAKADATKVIIDSLTASSGMLKTEEERLYARRKAIDNNIDFLKRNLENLMRATGKTKFKTDFNSFRLQKNPPALKYDKNIDLMSLPAEFVKFGKPTLDTDAVKKAINSGTKLDWATLEQSETIRIS